MLHAVMGLTPIHGGHITIDGEAPGKQVYERIAFVPDHLTMPPGMRISESLRFMEDFYKGWNMARAQELLQFFWSRKNGTAWKPVKGNDCKVQSDAGARPGYGLHLNG